MGHGNTGQMDQSLKPGIRWVVSGHSSLPD